MSVAPRAVATYLAARVLPALATMCLTFLCIHALRPEDYASYSLAMLAAGVAAGFVGGVSGQAMLRYSGELTPQALRHGLVAFPLLAGALACLLVLAYFGWRGETSAAALLATLAVPALALMDTRRSLFIARGRADAVFALDIWRACLALALCWGLLRVWGAHAAAPLLAQLLAVVACLILVQSPNSKVSQQGRHRSIDAQYVGYGVGIAGGMGGIVAMSLAERSVVADALGLAASGHYSAQADVINAAFSAAAGALAAAMMPAYLAQTHDPDLLALRRLRRLALASMLLVAALCLLLGVALSCSGAGRISSALTGDVSTGIVLVAAGTVWATAGFVQKPLELRGRTYLLAAGVAAALLSFILVAPVLAERSGSTGVALAKLSAGLLYAAITMGLDQATRKDRARSLRKSK